MTRPIVINYEGSDMDVSSDDELQLPHENMVQQLRHHIQQQERHQTPIQPHVETFLPRKPIAIDDSDTESVDSFKTAPDTLPDEPIEVMTHDLERQLRDLEEQLRKKRIEGDFLQKQLQDKKAEREALRIKRLEKSVRNSIRLRKKQPLKSILVTDTKKKKGKEKDMGHSLLALAQTEKPLSRSYQKQYANFDPQNLTSDVLIKDEIKRRERIKKDEQSSEQNPTEQNKELTEHKPVKQEEKNHKEKSTKKQKVMPAIKQSEVRKKILESFQLSKITPRQMKIQLCDLWEYAKNHKLSLFQEVNARELRKKLIRRLDQDENMPAIVQLKKGRKYTPTKHLLLGPEYYGHPDMLDYDTFDLTQYDIYRVIEDFAYLSPKSKQSTKSLEEEEPKESTTQDNKRARPEETQDLKKPKLIATPPPPKKQKKKQKTKGSSFAPLYAPAPPIHQPFVPPFILPMDGSFNQGFLPQSTERPYVPAVLPNRLPLRSQTISPAIISQQVPPQQVPSQQVPPQQVPPQRVPPQQISSPFPMAESSNKKQEPKKHESKHDMKKKYEPRYYMKKKQISPERMIQIIDSVEEQDPVNKSNRQTSVNHSNDQTPAKESTSKPSFTPYQSVVSALGVSSIVRELAQSKENLLKEATKPIPNHVDTQPAPSQPAKRTELCNAESAGGVCRVRNCPFVHFSDFQS
ncbi:uncharacterized protein B0P05DRAFT_560298 [Gilbertella persicaria]|uniref:uncharacterized protein n=1 Tax=Gilbertella persicaria TaxID=101096 RepID=UPI00221FCCF9|nr:uncharacterized protein B0P05DRAFT_560298 [Gilbertella persicaria]KAI8056296.1 hypothetical protein B0P05DRAFT_560298 [Gilbertella persicaria]